jgi:translation initiation factor 2 alpha subunit (eIF-2alpha)
MNFFENKLPKVGDHVIVTIMNTSDAKVSGVSCILPFYNNIDGLIMPTELLKGRREKISKVCTKGQKMICVVMTVDESRNYIDLSRRRVHSDDEKIYKVLFDKMNRVMNFMGTVINFYCEYNENDENELSDEIKLNILSSTLWNLTENMLIEPADNYDMYEKILNEPIILFKNVTNFLSLEFIEHCVEKIKKRTVSEPYVIEYCFDMTSMCDDGVDTLNKIMKSVFGDYTTNTKYIIELFSLPTYKVTFQCQNKVEISDTITLIENKLTDECSKYQNVIVKFNTNPKFKNTHNVLKQKSIAYSNGNINK